MNITSQLSKSEWTSAEWSNYYNTTGKGKGIAELLVNKPQKTQWTSKDWENYNYASGAGKGIAGLLTNKPQVQWSPTDWKNYNYAVLNTPNVNSLQAGTQNLPDFTPQAPNVQNSYLNSVGSNLTTSRANLENEYTKRISEIDKQKETYQKQLDDITGFQELALEDVQSLMTPFRANLENTERERFKIEENYFANQDALSELETLYNGVKADTESMTGRTSGGGIWAGRLQKSIETANGRIGILQAVMSARSNQISTATNLIDRSVSAINADRQDQLTYYNGILDFYKTQKSDIQGLLKTAIGDKQDIIKSQLGFLENDMKQSEDVANKVKELLLNPDNAKMIQESGISLADSVEEINKKMADWQIAHPEEVANMIKQYPDANIQPTDTIEIATAKLKNSKIYQQETRLSGGGSGGGTGRITKNQQSQIEQNLLSQLGGDGFVSPDDYAAAKQDWIQAGGSPSDFDTKFKDRRNPDNNYYDVTGENNVNNATNETDITDYKNQGYTADDLVKAGYDKATVEKVFKTTKKTNWLSSWWGSVKSKINKGW